MAIKISNKGYKRNSPDKGAKKLRIPSNQITMENVDFPVIGTDNFGYTQIMQPGMNYTFPNAEYVDEMPLAKSGIHIKPENRGKFTAYKKRTGKTTEEALHSKDPHVRQMANFARMAKRGFKKLEEGGLIYEHSIGDKIEVSKEYANHLKSLGYDFEVY